MIRGALSIKNDKIMISIKLAPKVSLNLNFEPNINDLDFWDLIKVSIDYENHSFLVGNTNILEFIVDSEKLIDDLLRGKLEIESRYLHESLSHSFQLERDKVYSEQIHIRESNLERLTEFQFLSLKTNLFFYNLEGKKYFEVSPTYPRNYDLEDSKEADFITFQDWFKVFKPHFKIELSDEPLAKWMEKCKSLRYEVDYMKSSR